MKVMRQEIMQTNIKHSEMLFKDLKKIEVTKNTKQSVLDNPRMYQRCGYRILNGMFRTDIEQEEYIKKSLERKLPGKTKVLRRVK